MKKLTFLTLALIILFSAHQVSAVSDKANERARNNPSVEKKNEQSDSAESDEENDEVENENEVQTTRDGEWKNHGQYVSSVAKTNPGGQVVSEAARSDIGKKNYVPEPTDEPELTVNPTDDPELTPSPTEDPEASPSPTLTNTPTPTPDEDQEDTVGSIINAIEELLNTLKGLLNL